MKPLTKDDFQNISDMDYSWCINAKINFCNVTDKEADELENQILKNQEKAEMFNKFTSIFYCSKCSYVCMEKGKNTTPIQVDCPNCKGEEK